MSYEIQSITGAGHLNRDIVKKAGLTVKVKEKPEAEISDVVKNPFSQDKIILSHKSLKEELALLKSQEQKKESSRAAIDDLKSRLLQIESVLHQVAATLSFDADSLEEIQKRIMNEINASKMIMKRIDLPGLKEFNLESIGLDPNLFHIKSEEDLDRAREALAAAAGSVEKLRDLATTTDSERRTGQVLEVAHQNTAAALSTYDPQAVFARADNVAQTLRDESAAALKAHSGVNYQGVINLIG
jgi:uncharacterized protein YdaU (DUF1376 family)